MMSQENPFTEVSNTKTQDPSNKQDIAVSVIITTYDIAVYDKLKLCLNSVLRQSFNDAEYECLVVSETEEITNRLIEDYSNEKRLRVIQPKNKQSLVTARNLGATLSQGDIITFIDDDAYPTERTWLNELYHAYDDESVVAAGGPAYPVWEILPPKYLPSEYFWLVGATYTGMDESGNTKRNTFGCNISFKKSTFSELGGFSENLGKRRQLSLQGEETELCQKIQSMDDCRFKYVESASVNHHVFKDQVGFKNLFKRSYLQGVTKAIIERETESQLATESNYLKFILFAAIPNYTRSSIKNPTNIFTLIGLLSFTLAVGIGYLIEKYIP